ncbi:MAG: hypothetical protein CL607_27675 [Anaerolineaceae bacterium]|nr:hypothetical protein [Anaerolineaceae bacterium]
MNKKTIGLVVIVLAMLTVAVVVRSQDSAVPEEKPKLNLTELVPLQQPEEDFKEVAVLTLQLSFTDEGIRGAQMSDAYIQRSYAPNVFNLQGPIEVMLRGEQDISFSVVDPRPEVENPRASEEGAEDVPLHLKDEDISSVAWELVVPLYKDDRALGAETIAIAVDGEVIFEQAIDYDAWRKRADERQNDRDDQQDQQEG